MSISGKIVDVGTLSAGDIISKLYSLQKQGSLVKYSGRNIVTNVQIQSFSTTHPNNNTGGADFSMTLREVRIAKSSYNPKAKKTQTQKKNSPNLTVGAIVVFKGGNVYVSSDAKKPAAKRGRSTCKITIINKRSWAIHPYHLISTDGGMVYGWVDKANIEGVPSSGTSAKTNAGTQQVQTNSGNAKQQSNKISMTAYTYYTVRKGDTVTKLVNRTFKDSGLTIKDILDTNPDAFAVKGVASTLKAGARLKIPKKGSNYSRTHGGGGGTF